MDTKSPNRKVTSPSRKWIEVASWHVVSELYRRHPGRFTLLELHPGRGRHDCLSLVAPPGQLVAHVDRKGGFYVRQPFGGGMPTGIEPEGFWSALVRDEDWGARIGDLVTMIGLPIPEHMPPSTHESLVYRFIARFLGSTGFRSSFWECRNGYHESSGEEGCFVQTEYFQPFSSIALPRKSREPHRFPGHPANRFWFLLKNGRPRLCLESAGLAHTREGRVHELHQLYQRNDRRLWPVIMEVAGDLLD